MGKLPEGSVVSFPDFADIRIVRSDDKFKAGQIDFHGYVVYVPAAPIAERHRANIGGVYLKIFFAVNVKVDAHFTNGVQDETGAEILTERAVDAVAYVGSAAAPDGWIASGYCIFPVKSPTDKPEAVKHGRHHVVDTWTTNEIRLNGRTSDKEQWVRYVDHVQKVNELQAALAKGPK